MCKLIKRFLYEEKAAVLPLAALLIPVLISMASIGVDVSGWMMERRDLQTAADAAALAGAWEIARGADEDVMEFAAIKEAINNGYDPNTGAITIVYDEDESTVNVDITQDADLFLANIVGDVSVDVQADGTAEVITPPGDFCILSLDEFVAGAITTSGTVDLIMPECGIAVNSTDDEAFQINGNVLIDIENLSVVGDFSVSGGAADLDADTIETGSSVTPDPYEDIEPDGSGACDFNNFTTTGDATLSPGVYCGGIRITGNNDVTFEPGYYVIAGGDFDVSGGGSLYGEEISFFLTENDGVYAQLDITGSKDIFFSAPPEGEEIEGVVFFQDRNAPQTGNVSNNLTGTADIYIDGVMYFPAQELNFGGNTAVGSDICTKVIANTVILHGTPFLGNECEDSVALDITKLAEVELVN